MEPWIVPGLIAIIGLLLIWCWNSLSQRIQDGQKTTEKAYEHIGKRIDRLEENIRSDVKSMNDRIDRDLDYHLAEYRGHNPPPIQPSDRDIPECVKINPPEATP